MEIFRAVSTLKKKTGSKYLKSQAPMQFLLFRIHRQRKDTVQYFRQTEMPLFGIRSIRAYKPEAEI